jgi:predicted transglutaminase-like cysteine proteinase
MKYLARKIKDQVDPLFQGKSGPWGSHADAVELGRTFEGDCKAYAMTCAELLIKHGAAPAQVRIVRCITDKGENHLVCVYGWWVIDNEQKHIWAWDELGYEWKESMKMSEPGIWREVKV